MTDNNRPGGRPGSNEEKTIQEILNDEINRQLTENPPAKPSLEEFRAMAYERLGRESDRKRHPLTGTAKRRLRTAGIAAVLVLAMLTAPVIVNLFTSDVGADKTPKDETVSEDGVVIDDGARGGDGEENILAITDWHDVEGVKAAVPDLLIPEYIPEGYKFQQLDVELLETGDVVYKYLFYNENHVSLDMEVFSTASALNAVKIENSGRMIESKKGMVYIQDSEKKATIQMHDGDIILIWGSLNDSDLIKMIDGMAG